MHQLGSGRVRWVLIGVGASLSILLLVLPVALIVSTVAGAGWGVLKHHLADPDMRSALTLTLIVTAITVPVNVIFGTALAWCVTRFDFVGRRLLMAVVDMPYALSPVIAGLCYLLLYGLQSPIGEFFDDRGVQIMFATPGIVMVTIFVTCPYVARELIPLMQSQGKEEEEAAMMLGAGGWSLFWRV